LSVEIHLAETGLYNNAARRQKLAPGGHKVQQLSMGVCITRFIRNEAGATAIEYGLIAAGIAVAIIATVQALGTNLSNTFSTVSTALK